MHVVSMRSSLRLQSLRKERIGFVRSTSEGCHNVSNERRNLFGSTSAVRDMRVSNGNKHVVSVRASSNVGHASFENGPGTVRFGASSGSPSILEKAKSMVTAPFRGAKLDREYLTKLGLGALLSYGFISNVNAITIVIISWVTTGRTTGLSPLAAGNWKVFIGTYTALYLSFGNMLRPLRISVSVAISPFFKKLVDKIKATFKVSQAVAVGITVFLVNVCGTLSYLFGGVWLASLVFRVPLLP